MTLFTVLYVSVSDTASFSGTLRTNKQKTSSDSLHNSFLHIVRQVIKISLHLLMYVTREYSFDPSFGLLIPDH
jgi:hypothetical protein